MKPVARGEILGLADYEVLRERFRARVVAEKRYRRVALGPRATALFENHDTVLLQIQEMLRTERITKESAILHEMETYNALVPGPAELSATVFVEIEDKAERDTFLREAKGLERTFALRVDGVPFPAQWAEDRELEDRTSAVLYLKFPLSSEAARAMADRRAQVELAVDHPRYRAVAVLPPPTLASLAEDLQT